jgi:hypothetical protein
MLTKNIDKKSELPVETNSSALGHARLLSNDLGEEEAEIDSEHILMPTLDKIKKNRKNRKVVWSKPFFRRSSRLKK